MHCHHCHTPAGHEGQITALQFAAENPNILWTASQDATLRWEQCRLPLQTGSLCLACIPCSPALSDPAGAGTCGCRRVPIRQASSPASTAYHSAVWPSAQLALPWQQAQRWKRRTLTSFSGECRPSLLHPLLCCVEYRGIIPYNSLSVPGPCGTSYLVLQPLQGLAFMSRNSSIHRVSQ